MLTLTRPLVVLDVETTGTLPALDRIVSIALLTIRPDGTEEAWSSLVNPERPIPAEATAIHGITDEMVKDAPTWATVGLEVAARLKDSDIAGYRVKFDLAMLRESFDRERIPTDLILAKVIDAARLWQVLEPRTLEDAVTHFLNPPACFVFDAHNAEADVRATWKVLQAQLALEVDLEGSVVSRLPPTVAELHDLSWPWPKDALDPDGKIVFTDGAARLTFGKHAGTALTSLRPDYLEWMCRDQQDFSPEVKALCRRALAREVIGPR